MTTEPELVDEPVRWGPGHAVGVFLAAQIASFAGLFSFAALTGISSQEEFEDLSIGETALLQLPLWAGLIGGSIFVVGRWGGGLVRSLGFTMTAKDVPLGLLLGVACQLVLVPLVMAPILVLTDFDSDDVSRPAEELADKATGLGVLVLVFVVVIMAPLAEEIFFRGLLQRSIGRHLGTAATVACTSIAFGLSHFQLVQLPALVAFGIVLSVVTIRRGTLGLALWTHLGFNLTTVLFLLAS